MKMMVTMALVYPAVTAVCIAEGKKDYPVTPVPFTAVQVRDGFWSPRMETNRTVTVKADFRKCEETGRIDNFAKAGGLMPGGFKGIPFDDSDVFKVIEGASYTLAMHPDPELDKYLDGVIARIWENVVFKKLYLTGGIGSSHGGEAFGRNYELPNKTAYNETCAAIANALWNYRMFLLHGEARYLDVLERVIYNGFLSGVGLTGDRFFYPNPLASDKGYERSPWFGCACCPVNVVRFMPSIAGFVYAARDQDVFVNLFIGGTGELRLGQQVVKITQQTKYPWEGRIRLTIDPATAAEFALNLRIPGWAQGKPVPGDLYTYMDQAVDPVELKVNGNDAALNLRNGFASIKRQWQQGDVVEVSLPMAIRRVVANEAVKDDAGLVAIERGPMVYCLEGADNDHVFSFVLPDDAKLVAERREDLLGGITVIKGDGRLALKDEAGKTLTKPAGMLAIPYYAWCNRGPHEMNVWFARTADKAQPVPANTTNK